MREKELKQDIAIVIGAMVDRPKRGYTLGDIVDEIWKRIPPQRKVDVLKLTKFLDEQCVGTYSKCEIIAQALKSAIDAGECWEDVRRLNGGE